MSKRKRYQLREEQLKDVVQFISENYPAGVGDWNIDQLSGGDYDDYDYIDEVDYDTKTGDLVFDISTTHGGSLERKIWAGDTNFIVAVETELKKQGHDLEEIDEWDIINAQTKDSNVIITVGDYKGNLYHIPIHKSEIFEWLPEVGDDY